MSLYEIYNKEETDKDEYRYKVSQYFLDSLQGVELDKENIRGKQGWHDGIYEFIIIVDSKLMVDNEKLIDNIYFYIAENRGWYDIYANKYIYFYFDNKCYEIYLAYGKWDNMTKKFEVCGKVHIRDKSFLNLGLSELHFFHDRYSKHPQYDSDVEGKYFCFQLEDGQNLISEILKRFKKKNRERSRNNSNNKGM